MARAMASIRDAKAGLWRLMLVSPCRRALRLETNLSDPTPSSSQTMASSSIGVSNWPNWRHTTRFPQYIKTAYMPKSVG